MKKSYNNIYSQNGLKESQEDCRPLHTEPLTSFKAEELPQQAVVQKGLSAFYNSFNG